MLVRGAMFAFLTKLLLVARSRLKSRASLEAENLLQSANRTVGELSDHAGVRPMPLKRWPDQNVLKCTWPDGNVPGRKRVAYFGLRPRTLA